MRLSAILLLAAVAWAGPSFNSDRKELAEQSRQAGAALHQALADVHLMLEYLELGQIEKAERRRQDALETLDSAIDRYKQLAEKAPRQKLITDPHTDLEKAAVESLPRALRTRNLEMPATEQQLAQLAESLVWEFRKALSNSPRFDKTTLRAYAYFERLLREEGFLLNVGIYASVIWSMQETQGQ
jgi:hypothetical protein